MGILNREGALYMATGIDNTGLIKDAKEAENIINNLGDSTSKVSSSIKQVITELGEQMLIQKKVISDLEKQYESARTSFDKVNIGTGDIEIINQRKEASQLLKEVRSELNNEKEALKVLEDQYGKLTKEQSKFAKQQQASSQKQQTFLTQIRNIREEMTGLINADGSISKENLNRYNQLRDELTEVGTAYRKVREEQKLLTTKGNEQLAGLIQGISGVAGAFSTAQGVASLFVKDNERLAAIQTKLQAAMSITIGLQQVSSTLHSTSAFRIAIVTKATQLWNSSVKALNVNLGISQVLSKGLVGIGIGALIAGIIIAVNKYKEWNKQQEETKRLNKIVTDSLKESAQEGEKAAKKETVSLNLLYKATQDENKSKKERITAAKKMQELYPNYFGNLSKEGILAGKGADAYNRLTTAIIAAAKARAAQDRITENQSKILDLEAKITEENVKKEKALANKLNYESKVPEVAFGEAGISGTLANSKMARSASNNYEEAAKSIYKYAQEIGQLNQANKELAESVNITDLLFDPKKEVNDLKTAESAAEKARKQAQKIADEELKLRNNTIKAELDAQNAKLDNRQKEINLMEDSFAKEQAQLDLNHDKELLAIDKRTQELIEKEQDARRKRWDIENPKGTKAPYKTDVTSILNLGIGDQEEIEESEDIANKKILKATKDLLKSMLAEYQDYYTQREEINKKYDSDLVTLESLPSSEENERAIAELKKRWQEALSSINLQEFQDQIDWSTIFGNLDKVSTDELVKLRNKLKQYLETVGKSLSPQDLKTVTDAFENLNEKIADKRPIQELKDGYVEYKSAIEEVIAAKKELAKYEEGTDGYVKATEALTAAEKKRADSLTKMSQSINKIGSVGSEMVNSGQELVGMLTNLGIEIPEAVSKALDGIGQVMGGLEKINLTNPASIISGAVSVVSGIGNFFAGIFGFGNKDKKKEKEIQRLQSQVEVLEKSYEKLGRAIEKAYSYNASGLINEQNEALEQQKLLIQQQIKKEEDKKKTDKDRVREWKEQLEQIDLLIEENKEKAIDAIFGQDVQSAIDDFANAYVDAWAAGEDRAKAMKDVVKKMIKGVIVEMLKSDLAPTVAKIRDKIQEYLTDGIIDATEQAELDRIIEQATKDADNKYGWADKYINENEDTRSSTAKGIATASQDSVDYLSGLWALSVEFSRSTNENVILIHTMTRDIVTSINELKQNSSSILMHVQNIDNNTESIRQDISGMREDINHMRIHGTQLAK